MTLPTENVAAAVWRRLREECAEAAQREPALAPLFVAVLGAAGFAEALAARLAARLQTQDVGAAVLQATILECLTRHPELAEAGLRDLAAVLERDPAVEHARTIFLHFKGYHAIQTQRVAHALWGEGRKEFALCLQSLSSEHFQVDIHPAARLGSGIMFDHATGIVIGETAVIEDNVSILHGVTLGGTGNQAGDRHPKVRKGAMIGAGAVILGNIEIGAGSRIGAGSVVLRDVPPCVTAAGNPAKIVGGAGCSEPARRMDQDITDAPALPETRSDTSPSSAKARG